MFEVAVVEAFAIPHRKVSVLAFGMEELVLSPENVETTKRALMSKVNRVFLS